MSIISSIFKKIFLRFSGSIKSKLSFCFMVIILLMLFVTVYSNYNLNILLKQYDKSLLNYSTLNDFFANNSELHPLLENYFVTKSDGAYIEYVKSYNKAFKLLKSFKMNMVDNTGMGKVIDLERMVQTYGENANKAIENLRIRKLVESYQYLSEAGHINKLIDTRFRTYFNIQFDISEQQRNELLAKQSQQAFLNYMIIVFSIVFCTGFVWLFSKGITRPIGELVKNAEQISRGNFDVKPVNPKNRDEMLILSDMFNKMVESIRFYISEMENKARLQKKLFKEENKNLKMETLLKETRLKALQAQINPHFLFNTLNAISQTAYIEEANQTRELLEATAELLRYNLDRTDKAVSLRDEITCMENYLYIQKKRFGDRIEFETIIDEELEDIMIPGLIIQPLIENAIIHGVDEYIKNGRVVTRIKKLSDSIVVEVEDNGVGMSEEKVRQILNDGQEDVMAGSSESIGIRNVKRRLELFFGRKDVFFISSGSGAGTVARLALPIIKKRKGAV